ncbi:unknown [Bacteroides sp. CAG:633]|nr:unknown [Bacteroides sp. CAG:633]
MGYLGDNYRAGVGRRPVVDAVYVAQYDEGLCVHHGGDKSAEFVVVGEHKFADGDGIVLVDDGDDTVLKHDGHAAFLVQVVAACAEALFHGEHLAYGYLVFAEELVIAVDEFGLAHGREQLALLDAIQPFGRAQLASP